MNLVNDVTFSRSLLRWSGSPRDGLAAQDDLVPFDRVDQKHRLLILVKVHLCSLAEVNDQSPSTTVPSSGLLLRPCDFRKQ